jgi:tellurite resistance protein
MEVPVFGLKGFKDKLTGASARMSGRTDALEAICAAAALVAAADGDIEDAEVEATTKAVSTNPTVSGAFSPAQINQSIDKMLKRAESGRAGRMGLYKEIEDIASDHELSELVLLTALDIADSDGELEPEEQKVIEKIGQKLGLDARKYMDV